MPLHRALVLIDRVKHNISLSAKLCMTENLKTLCPRHSCETCLQEIQLPIGMYVSNVSESAPDQIVSAFLSSPSTAHIPNHQAMIGSGKVSNNT